MVRSKRKKDYVRQRKAERRTLLAFLSTRRKTKAGDWRKGFGVFPEDVEQIKNKKSRADKRRRRAK